jgi:rubrerythrin
MSELNTFNDVLKVAIEKEEDAVEFYTKATGIIKNPGTSEMLKDFAKEEQSHVTLLKDAQKSKTIESVGNKTLPQSMDLTKYLVSGTITEDSTPQDVMIIAMKREDSAVSFYSEQITAFEGTDIAELFQRLCNTEKEHKERLEAEYEKVFMPDN